MIKLLKRLFAWLFSSKPKIEKEEPTFEKFAEEKPFSKPEPLPQKKREPIVHKIPPDRLTEPRSYCFRKPSGGSIQMVHWWDDQYFPARWRTKLIYH